jgi:hypothetical protein
MGMLPSKMTAKAYASSYYRLYRHQTPGVKFCPGRISILSSSLCPPPASHHQVDRKLQGRQLTDRTLARKQTTGTSTPEGGRESF